MKARKTQDKNADREYRTVLPPEYRAGGYSMREDMCQQDSQRIHHDDGWSIKLWATASGSSIILQRVSSSDEKHDFFNQSIGQYMCNIWYIT